MIPAWYLVNTLGRSYGGGAYLFSVLRDPGHAGAGKARWGVVQLVGHLTVNEDGEGSNPSAPAKSSSAATGRAPRQSMAVGKPASTQPFQPPSMDSTLV